jgi:hypothetical protein
MWVAEHSSKVNAAKRERMDEADQRSQQVEELNAIKEKIAAAKGGDPTKLAEANSELNKFIDKYTNEEGNEELVKTLTDIRTSLNGQTAPQGARPTDTPENGAAWDKTKADWEGGIEERMKSIDNLAQTLGQRDQIEMMRITTLDQAENRFYELGSNKIANDGKTANALIANIRV